MKTRRTKSREPRVGSREGRPLAWASRPASFACIVCLLLAILALTSCSRKESSPTLATVGERKITVADFQREVERRVTARRPLPAKEALLQEMVAYEAFLQRAHRARLADDPQIQHEINNLLIAKIQERELAARVAVLSVSAAEVQAEYEQNLAKYTQPAKARLAILFQETSPTTSEAKRSELRARLDEARRKLLENPAPGGRGPAASGFGALAIEYSQDQTSRYRGGDIGWLDVPARTGMTATSQPIPSRWPREVLEAGFALEKGRVSDLIETDRGLYLVMKTDFRESVARPLAEMAATLEKSLLGKKRHEAEEAFRQETLRLAGAHINQAALASVKLSLPEAAVAQHHKSGPPGLPAGSSTGGN